MNILVTAIGSYAAGIVIKTLKKNQHYVIGCDVFPREWIADAGNVDVFVQAPYAHTAEDYYSFIKSVCRQFSIQFILPLTDPEVDLLSSMKEELLNLGVTACVPDGEVTRRCRDKYLLPRFMHEQNLCTTLPTFLLNSDETETSALPYPLLAKPRFGRSSEGLVRIQSDAGWGYVKELAQDLDYIIQPCVEGGRIITVDLVRSQDGAAVCVARRELLRNPSGAGTTVEIIEYPALTEICGAIANALGIIGAVNLEFMEADQLYLLEINPRFSGGVEFSHMAGYDVVSNHLRCFLNQKIETQMNIKKMIIARKYEEYITKML